MEAAEQLACIEDDKKRTNEILERRSEESYPRPVDTEPPAQTQAQKVRREVFGILAVPLVAVLVFR